MRFRIVMADGHKLPFVLNLKTTDKDVAKVQAEKVLGAPVLNAIPA